ncbi:MAG: lipid kinase [Prevotellaceae bacterium]|nr:lipid kinase [Candidatus Colivivens caballi]
MDNNSNSTHADRWGVIYSTKAGFINSHKRWLAIQKYMERKGVQYDFVQSEGSGSVERLTRMLCSNHYSTIIVVGNDAALNEALNGVLKTKEELAPDFAFGLIPNGIGNDFARFWDVEVDDYKKTVDKMIKRHTRTIDVGLCTYTDDDNVPHQRYFLNCVNIGLGARLIDYTDKFTRLMGSKRLSLMATGIANIFERKSFNVQLKADTEEISSQVMSICIGNCHGYGQTPNSVPYNGMLDMSIITRPKWWQLFEGFWLLGKGRFLNYTNVHPYRVQKVSITDAGKAKVSVDGCILDMKKLMPMRAEIVPDAINFIV